ncbi:MAG: DMT family transporter [Candidatus Wallbacteria bacterium]|nr:DMT family transporter [Candidatus Wallbacteria bacterium]
MVDNKRKAMLLLLLVSFFWGLTFVLVKEGISLVNVYTFLSWRFLIATLAIIPFFYRRIFKINGPLLLAGFWLGLALTLGYDFQTYGLLFTTPSKSAFITGLYIVMVPIFLAIGRKSTPRLQHIAAVALATTGLALLTVSDNFTLNPGDIWTFFCAIAYAIHIILINIYSRKFDPLPLTFIQMLVVAVINTLISAGSGVFEIPESIVVWRALLFCALIATTFVLIVQNAYQKYLSEVTASIIYSFEPVFAGLTSWLYLGEKLTLKILLGGVLIFAGMIISELCGQETKKPAR